MASNAASLHAMLDAGDMVITRYSIAALICGSIPLVAEAYLLPIWLTGYSGLLVQLILAAPILEEAFRLGLAALLLRSVSFHPTAFDCLVVGLMFGIPEAFAKLAFMAPQASNDGLLFYSLASVPIALLMHGVVTVVMVRLCRVRRYVAAAAIPALMHIAYNAIAVGAATFVIEHDLPMLLLWGLIPALLLGLTELFHSLHRHWT